MLVAAAKRFAATFGVEVEGDDGIKRFVIECVRDGWRHIPEAGTEQDRQRQLLAYFEWRLENSIAGRIMRGKRHGDG